MQSFSVLVKENNENIVSGQPRKFVRVSASCSEERVRLSSPRHDPDRTLFVGTARDVGIGFGNHSGIASGKTSYIRLSLHQVKLHRIRLHQSKII